MLRDASRILVLALLVVAGFAAEVEHREAKVALAGRAIATLRAVVAGYAPEERAEIVHQRLLAIAEANGPGVVACSTVADGLLLTVDGTNALLLVPDDADRLFGESLAAAGEQARLALTEALVEQRKPLAGDSLLLAWLAVAGITLAWLAALTALVWIVRQAQRVVLATGRLVTERIGQRELSSFIRDQCGHFIRVAALLGAWVAGLLATYVWLSAVLLRFRQTQALGEELRGSLGDWASRFLAQVISALPNLGVVVVIILITSTLAHLIHLFFARIENRRLHLGWLNHDTALPTRRLTTLTIWLFALAMAYPYLPGSGSEAFKGVSVLVGVMVSLGASGLVGQAASGFIVTYLGVIRAGDYVKVGETEGEVATIGIFSTRIITVFKEAVSVPNVLIMSQQLLNYSQFPGQEGVVVRTRVTIGYTVPWRQLHALLIEAARRCPDLRAEPAPYILQRSLADFYVEYELCAHLISPRRRIPVLAELHQHIQDLCHEQGIQIMSPHYLGDPAQPALASPTAWAASLTLAQAKKG
jgi:small-conductance mechanosensitive channel